MAALNIEEKTYNGISILEDEEGFFNVSKLVNHYQPNNKNTARFLRTKKLAEIFDSKALEYQKTLSPPNGGGSRNDQKLLNYKDVSIRMKGHTSDAKRSLRGLYLPKECLNVILMILDPNYRATVNAMMDTVNEAYDGKALSIKVENSSGKSVEKTIEFDSSVWQDHMAHSLAGDDEREYWRCRDQLSDKMW
jgi:hypothetical protein